MSGRKRSKRLVVVPMHVERSYTGIGDENSGGYLTWRIFPDGNSSFTVHHPQGGNSTSIKVEESERSIKIRLTGLKQPHILHLHLSTKPKNVELDDQLLSDPENYVFDVKKRKLIIKTEDYSIGEYTIIK